MPGLAWLGLAPAVRSEETPIPRCTIATDNFRSRRDSKLSMFRIPEWRERVSREPRPSMFCPHVSSTVEDPHDEIHPLILPTNRCNRHYFPPSAHTPSGTQVQQLYRSATLYVYGMIPSAAAEALQFIT